MKSLLDFLKYNNAFPIILSVVILGTGAAFAASPDLRQAVFSPSDGDSSLAKPKKTDAVKLLSADIGNFDLGIRIDAITEVEEAYHVVYSYRTLEVSDGEWKEARKSGKMDIFKGILGKRDFKAYLVEQIGQVIDREIAYLREAKSIAKGDIGSEASAAYASLVGTEIDAETRAKSAKQASSGAVVSEETVIGTSESGEEGVMSLNNGLSREEINEMIVKAVSDFLAIDMSMPEDITESPVETVIPDTPTAEPVENASEPVTEEPTAETQE